MKCAWCHTPRQELCKCGRCKVAGYCDRVCQKKHWVLHKTYCLAGPYPIGHERPCETHFQVSVMARGCINSIQCDPSAPLEQTHLDAIHRLGLLSPLPLFWSQFLALRDSPLHGRGVFATRALPRGAAITFFPAHLVVQGMRVETRGDFPFDPSPEELEQLCDTYGHDLTPEIRLVGLPHLCDDKRLWGHLMNDAYLTDLFHDVPLEALRDRTTMARLQCEFYRGVIKNTNCVLLSHVLCTVVTAREIQPGEELLLHYNLPHWLEKSYGNNVMQENPFIGAAMQELEEQDDEYRGLIAAGKKLLQQCFV